MWTDWKQKIKEFADDITSPQFEEEEDDEAAVHGDEPLRLPHTAPSSAAKQESAPRPYQPQASGAAALPDDPSRRLEYTVERGARASVTLAAGAPRSPPLQAVELASSPSQPLATSMMGPPTATTQAAPSSSSPIVSTTRPAPAEATAAPSPLASHGPPVDSGAVASLQARLDALEEEKADMDARIVEYQAQVRTSHEETIAYYEARQAESEAALRTTFAEEKKALLDELAAYKKRTEAAEAATAVRAEQVRVLEQRLEELQALHDSAVAAAAASASARAVTSAEASAPNQPNVDMEAERQRREAAEEKEAAAAKAVHNLTEDNARLREQLAELREQLAQLPSAQPREDGPSDASEKDALESALRHVQEQLTTAETRLEESAQQCAASQALAAQHEALAKQRQEALVALQATLSAAEQHASTMEAALEKARQDAAGAPPPSAAADPAEAAAHEAQLAALTQKLDAALARATEAERVQQALREELTTLHTSTTQNMDMQKTGLNKEWESRLATVSGEKQTLQTRLEAAQRELDTLARARDEERTRLSAAGDASLAELREMNRKLETDVQHHDTLLQQLEATVEAALERAEVELPSGGFGRGERYSFSDLVAVLTSEFSRLVDEQDKMDQVLQEWEQTYEKAKEVNESLNAQLSEALRTSGVAQEAFSTTQHERDDLQQQVEQLEAHLDECEHELMEARRQCQALGDEKTSWAQRISATETGVADQQEAIQSLQHEVEASHVALAEREEELMVARRSVDNLQLALESFKQNRARDVQERTVDLQAEIELLRAQLAQADEFAGPRGASASGGGGGSGSGAADGRQRDQLMRELAAKNLEVTDLHGKLQELRRMLEDTARQLSGETMIDKGVVSHLMVNYIHAFVAQRKEADEMLKIMSGLLGWDDEMQERAGLLPGPLNPHPPETKGKRGFLSFGRRAPAAPSLSATPGRGGTSTAGASGKKPSLAALWVDFLMKESAGNASTSATATAASEAAGADVVLSAATPSSPALVERDVSHHPATP